MDKFKMVQTIQLTYEEQLKGQSFFQGPKSAFGCVSRGWSGKNCAATEWVEILFGNAKCFTEFYSDSVWPLYKHSQPNSHTDFYGCVIGQMLFKRPDFLYNVYTAAK